MNTNNFRLERRFPATEIGVLKSYIEQTDDYDMLLRLNDDLLLLMIEVLTQKIELLKEKRLANEA